MTLNSQYASSYQSEIREIRMFSNLDDVKAQRGKDDRPKQARNPYLM